MNESWSTNRIYIKNLGVVPMQFLDVIYIAEVLALKPLKVVTYSGDG